MFKKRETFLQNLAFIAVMSAINAILAMIGSTFAIAGVFILIILPFFSCATTIVCKWRYYPIYIITSIAVSLIAMAWNISYTFFYLFPSLLTGFCFGFCFNKNVNSHYGILISSILQTGLSYAFIPLINFIYDTNLISEFLILFNLTNKPYIDVMILSFIFLLSLVQILFSYIVLSNEFKKFNYEISGAESKILPIVGLTISVLVIPFIFIELSVSYLFMFMAMYISIACIVDSIYEKNKLIIIIGCSFVLISIIFIFAFNQLIEMPYLLLILNVMNISIIPFTIIYNLIKGRRKC